MRPLPRSCVSLCQSRHSKTSICETFFKKEKSSILPLNLGIGRWKCFIKVAAAPRRPQAPRSGARECYFLDLSESFAVVLRNLLLNRLRTLADDWDRLGKAGRRSGSPAAHAGPALSTLGRRSETSGDARGVPRDQGTEQSQEKAPRPAWSRTSI